MDIVLEHGLALLPVISELIPVEHSILIADTNKFLRSISTKNFAATMSEFEGQDMPSESSGQDAVKLQKTVHKLIPKDVHGVLMRSTGVPIKNSEGKVVGCLVLVVNFEVQEQLKTIAGGVAAAAAQMAASMQSLSGAAEKTYQGMFSLQQAGRDVAEQIDQTDDILRFINDVSANSNLLGLNAAIEAARAGEHGRGFAVVAEEIRKMAVNSAESVKKIKAILASIQQKSTGIGKEVTSLVATSQQQAGVANDIAAAIEELSASTDEIDKIAHALYK